LNTPSSNAGSPDSGDQKVGRNPPPAIPDHTLLRLIGKGSYGEVWLARNIMGTHRAVKVVYRSTFDNDGPYEWEFAGIRKFEPISRSHDSQVDILHIGRNDTEGYFYYVMELADAVVGQGEDGRWKMEDGGETRTQAGHPPSSILDPQSYVPRTLQHDIETRGRLPFRESLEISVALTNALKHLHANGLVHRDIKPSNIIFVNGIPKLADIGLVTESEATVSYVGAQGFMPPEGPGRPQGDIYSLGKVIYEICTGRDRLDFPALPPDFGDWPDRAQILELLTVSLKACEPEADKRYASANELSADLVMLQAGKSVRRLRVLERSWRWAAVLVALALLAAAGAWLVQLETRSRERTRQREVLVREAQMLRSGERQTGWSSNALQLLAKAGQVRLDDDLRTQAAATMGGMDAHIVKSFQKTGATFLSFDPQGRQLLMDGGEDGNVKIWDSQADQTKTFSTTNTGPVWFARDGSTRQFVSVGSGVCLILNPENGDKLQEFRVSEGAQDSELQALTVSDNAAFCAVAFVNRTNQSEGQVAVWETATGKLVARSDEACTALAFSPDGSCLASGDEEGRVRVRAMPELKEVAAFHQGRAPIHCLAFQRDPSQPDEPSGNHPWLLSAGDAGGTINIYQLASRKLKTICRGSYYDVYAVTFSPDGMTLASCGRGAVRLWDVVTGRSLLTMPGYDFGVALAFSSSGKELAVGRVRRFAEAGVSVIELEPDRGVAELRALSAQTGRVEFSHDGQRLAALSHNWEVGVWNLAANRLERVFEAPKGLVADNAAMAFSRDDSQLAFATLTDACLWDIQSGRLLRSWHLPQGLVQHLCFDPAGRLLHFQWDRPWEKPARMCRVRDLFSADYEKPLAEFPAMRGQIFDAVLSSKGDFVVVVGVGTNGNNIVKVFDPIKGRELCSLPDTGKHGSDWLATDPETSRVGYWLGTNKGTGFFKMPAGEFWRDYPLSEVRALSPDGGWLTVQAGDERGIMVFRTDNPAWRVTLGFDHSLALQSCFSPNGRLMAWGSAEGTVMVSDLEETIRGLERVGLGW
jgi:WD40 repeat protein